MSGSTGVRRTRGGDILVELKAGVKGGDVVLKIKEAIGDRVCVTPLQSRVPMVVKDIEPLESKADRMQDIQRIIEEPCEASLNKAFPPRGSRNPNYWRNNAIARLRRETLRKRRLVQRPRRQNKEGAVQLQADYRKRRKKLRAAFYSNKRLAWKEFTATFGRDPWGLPYKRVIARLRSSKQNVNLEREQAESIISKFFLIEDMGVANEDAIEENVGGTPEMVWPKWTSSEQRWAG